MDGTSLTVVFVTPELKTFKVRAGGLGPAVQELAEALAKHGVRVHVVSLLYDHRVVGARLEKVSYDDMKFYEEGSFDLEIFKEKRNVEFKRIKHNGVDFIFLHDPVYTFAMYHGDYLAQESFLAKGTLEVLKRLNVQPDIIHLNDGHTGLVAFFLKCHPKYSHDPFFAKTKLVYTIHNAGYAYQQIFDPWLKEKLEVNGCDGKIVWNGKINLTYAGVFNSDFVNTVSKDYEMYLKVDGEGLKDVFVAKDVIGIVNGIDVDYWRFPELRGRKCVEDVIDIFKPKWKEKLIEKLEGLTGKRLDENKMIIINPRRISWQKGYDTILPIIPKFLKRDVQFVFLGVAHPADKVGKAWAWEFRKLHNEHKGFIFVEDFNEELAKLMYWGGDAILYPSLPNKEPCGTGYMMAAVNGTPVIGTRTGGLVEKVVEFDEATLEGNGFLVWKEEYSPQAFEKKIETARRIFYSNEEAWKALMFNSAKTDVDMFKVAKRYLFHYNKLFE